MYSIFKKSSLPTLTYYGDCFFQIQVQTEFFWLRLAFFRNERVHATWIVRMGKWEQNHQPRECEQTFPAQNRIAQIDFFYDFLFPIIFYFASTKQLPILQQEQTAHLSLNLSISRFLDFSISRFLNFSISSSLDICCLYYQGKEDGHLNWFCYFSSILGSL